MKPQSRRKLVKVGKWAGGAIAVPIVVGLLSWGIVQLISSHSSPPSRTSVRVMRPFSSNKLNSGLTVARTAGGQCLPGSDTNVSSDAVRCSYRHRVVDPCFSGYRPDEVVCISNPWAKEVRILRSQHLPPPGSATVASANRLATKPPWAVELSNGERCTIYAGSVSKVAGLPIDYYCGPATAPTGGLIGTPNHSHPLWTARYVSESTQEIADVDVYVAWY